MSPVKKRALVTTVTAVAVKEATAGGCLHQRHSSRWW